MIQLLYLYINIFEILLVFYILDFYKIVIN